MSNVIELITELLKKIGKAHPVAIGALFTSGGLLYGNQYVPALMPHKLEQEWVTPAYAVLLFSAAILFYWVLEKVLSFIKRGGQAAVAIATPKALSSGEKWLLLGLGELGEDASNLDRWPYGAPNFPTKLEALELVDHLEKKGFIERNPYSISPLVSLTAQGRRKALELQRATSRAQ